MTLYDVPFFSNTPDETHCFQASIKMILKYFLPDKNFSWKELEVMSAKVENLWTWPTQAVINLFAMGFSIVDIDDFDIDDFVQNGGEYLTRKYGQQVGLAQIAHSDIKQEVKLYKQYQKLNIHQQSLPSAKDIRALLKKGYLVCCNVNYKSLYNLAGFTGHSILIIGFEGNTFFVHDPGLPGVANRQFSLKQFQKGWDYPDKKSRNLLAFKYSIDKP